MKRIIAIVLASLGIADLLFCVITPLYYYHQMIAVKCFAAIAIIALILILKEKMVPTYLGMVTIVLCIVAVLSDQAMLVGALLGVLAAILMFTLNTKSLPTWLVIVLCAGALYYSTLKVMHQCSLYDAGWEQNWYGHPEIKDSIESLTWNYIGILLTNIGLMFSVVALCFSKSNRKQQRIAEQMRVKPVLQREDDWICPCGRHNTVYTSTCVCGRSKREAMIPKATPRSWHCTCGRENPSYTATCVCGKNKREIAAEEKKEKSQ